MILSPDPNQYLSLSHESSQLFDYCVLCDEFKSFGIGLSRQFSVGLSDTDTQGFCAIQVSLYTTCLIA